MRRFFNALWRDESGQDMAEYILVVAVIALGAIVAMGFFVGKVEDAFNTIGDQLINQAQNPGGGA